MAEEPSTKSLDVDVAVVTPSYRPDLRLCEALCRSVESFLPTAQHYVVVDHRDMGAFRHLEGGRRVLVAKQDMMPRGLLALPMVNRWVTPWTARPLRGWLVQQFIKLAAADRLDERVLLLIDSDTFLIRPIPSGQLITEGRVRMFREDGAITASMSDHIEWYRNAHRLLGLGDPGIPPFPDYISSLITWDRRVVVALLRRVEEVSGKSWLRAMLSTAHMSEFLLYGVFVDHVLGSSAVKPDEDDRCLTYWDFEPLSEEAAEALGQAVQPTDLAALVSSHSHTNEGILVDLRRRLTEGTLS